MYRGHSIFHAWWWSEEEVQRYVQWRQRHPWASSSYPIQQSLSSCCVVTTECKFVEFVIIEPPKIRNWQWQGNGKASSEVREWIIVRGMNTSWTRLEHVLLCVLSTCLNIHLELVAHALSLVTQTLELLNESFIGVHLYPLKRELVNQLSWNWAWKIRFHNYEQNGWHGNSEGRKSKMCKIWRLSFEGEWYSLWTVTCWWTLEDWSRGQRIFLNFQNNLPVNYLCSRPTKCQLWGMRALMGLWWYLHCSPQVVLLTLIRGWRVLVSTHELVSLKFRFSTFPCMK